MIWFIITGFGLGMVIGLCIGRKLGIQETEHKLHVISGKKATKEFYKSTGLKHEE